MIKYIKVDWPEYQGYMEHPKFREECFFCADDNSYFIPEDIYNSVESLLEYPKKYENTNLGTIVLYETRAVVNGDQIYWYDNNIKKGNIALVYDNDGNWHISKITACAVGFPILLEDPKLMIGVNCELIGHYNPEITF